MLNTKLFKRKLTGFFFTAKNRISWNQWIVTDEIEVYLRASSRIILGEKHSCLDLANVNVPNPFQQRGIFKETFNILEMKNPYEYLFIENVHNPFLPEFFLKRGYNVSDGINFFKLSVCPGFGEKSRRTRAAYIQKLTKL